MPKIVQPHDTPVVSVVITCYNYARYLKGCLESVLAQTFRDIEVIVVNDGSTDNTDEVIRPFLDDSRVKYISQANAGQTRAKNEGIRNARGEFIAFLDADDCWEPTKLEKQLPLFRDPGVGVVYSTARYIDEHGNSLAYKLTMRYLQPQEGWVARHLLYDNFVPFSSSVVRRKVLDKVGTFDENLRMGIDWDLWLRISVHYRFQYVNESLLVYRMGHPGQMSKNIETRHSCSDLILDRFIRNYPDLITPALMRRVLHYTYTSRGGYFQKNDLKVSTACFAKAFWQWPFSAAPIWGLSMNALLLLLRSSYMDFHQYIDYVLSDLHRYDPDQRDFFRHLLEMPGFCYSFWMRTARYLKSASGIAARAGYVLSRLLLRRYTYRYGIDIPYNTDIGHGLYIGHHGGIVVSPDARIGRNCNINHGVTIGTTYGGKYPGTPVIGDRVYLGPGSKVIGGITVGNNVAVGANAVVTAPVPDNAVVAGIPARVVSDKGSVDYIVNTV